MYTITFLLQHLAYLQLSTYVCVGNVTVYTPTCPEESPRHVVYCERSDELVTAGEQTLFLKLLKGQRGVIGGNEECQRGVYTE